MDKKMSKEGGSINSATLSAKTPKTPNYSQHISSDAHLCHRVIFQHPARHFVHVFRQSSLFWNLEAEKTLVPSFIPNIGQLADQSFLLAPLLPYIIPTTTHVIHPTHFLRQARLFGFGIPLHSDFGAAALFQRHPAFTTHLASPAATEISRSSVGRLPNPFLYPRRAGQPTARWLCSNAKQPPSSPPL